MTGSVARGVGAEPDEGAVGLYVHLPWCLHRCAYCDFNAHALRGPLPEREYVEALLADLDHELREHSATPRVDTVFIGGGTPSLFSPEAIGRLLDGVAARLDVADDVEITLEANPGSAERTAYRAFREAGVTRLSVGVQSFHDRLLQRLGRIHDGEAARSAVQGAMDAGFDSVNLDLMYALPGQSIDAACADVEAALALGVPHVSHYQLTVEPGTPLAADVPGDLPDDDGRADMEEACVAGLLGSGLARYEVSAYARPGHACRHNLGYWGFRDYLGVGAGAHGKRTAGTPQGRQVVRTRRVRSPRLWMAGAGTSAAVAESSTPSREERLFEVLLNGLRLADGIHLDEASRRAAIPRAELEKQLAPWLEAGWLRRRGARIGATAYGWRFLDSLLMEFIEAA